MRLWGILVFFLLAPSALADGGYFKSVRMSEKPPTIPYQRAIVRYDHGIETLVVESVLNGASGEYAWIIPVASAPIKIEAATRGTLPTAVELSMPRISTPDMWVEFWILSMPIALFLLTLRPRLKKYESLGRAIASELMVCALVFIIGAIFFPVFASGRPSFQIGSVRTVGNYQVAEIQGEDGPGIVRWLAQNNFHVPAEAHKAIEGYARDGWHFVAARLNKGTDDTSHPLQIEFRSPKPVYPMRLTQMMGEPLRLDLLVIGREEAVVPPLEVWSSSPGPEWSHHPELQKLEIPGGTWTYLRGELSKEEMAKDFAIEWKSPDHRERLVATKKSALTFAALASLAAFSILTIVLLFAERFGRVSLIKGFGLVVLLSALVGWWRFNSFEHVEAVVRKQKVQMLFDQSQLKQRIQKKPLTKPFEVSFQERVRSVSEKPDWLSRNSDVPYGYELRKTAAGYEFVVYDLRARPKRYAIGDDGRLDPEPK